MTSCGKKSRVNLFFRGIGLQILLGFPAGIAQALGAIDGISGSPVLVRLAVPFLGLPFNMGGVTTRVAFEYLVGPLEFLVGHRSATVLSNFPFYLVLLSIQVCCVAAAFAARPRSVAVWKDPVWLGLGLLILLNSLANVHWPWWGT